MMDRWALASSASAQAWGFPRHSARRPTLRHNRAKSSVLVNPSNRRQRTAALQPRRPRLKAQNKQTKTNPTHTLKNSGGGVLPVLVVFMKNSVPVPPSGQTLILDPPRLTHKGHLNACRLLHGHLDDCADETVARGSFRLNKLKH